jgi:hypothetical protein
MMPPKNQIFDSPKTKPITVLNRTVKAGFLRKQHNSTPNLFGNYRIVFARILRYSFILEGFIAMKALIARDCEITAALIPPFPGGWNGVCP